MLLNDVVAIGLLLLGAYVSALAVLVWLRWGERGRKERWEDLILTFFGGAVVAVLIATVLEISATALLVSTIGREYDLFSKDPTLITFIVVIIIAPVVEEISKALVVLRFSRYIWRPRNGLVFGAACGLGFAATENFLYEGTALFLEGFVAFVILAVIRSISSGMMHASATSISGYGIARAKTYDEHWWPYVVIAIGMHASFNLFASFGDLFASRLGPGASLFGFVFSLILVTIAVSFLRRRISGYRA